MMGCLRQAQHRDSVVRREAWKNINLRGGIFWNGGQLVIHGLSVEFWKLAWCGEGVPTAIDPVLAHLEGLLD